MSDEHSRKRGQRIQLACVPCRQGKLKCDRTYPACNQCHKRSREEVCTYTERGLRYNAAKQKADAMRKKLDRLEIVVNALRGSDGDHGSEDVLPGATPLPSDSVRSGKTLQTAGKLRMSDAGGTQYIGPSHWETIIEDIGELKAYFDEESSPDLAAEDGLYLPHNSGVMPADIVFGITRTYNQEAIIQSMPPRAVLDRFVATWFNGIDSLRLILHGPTFQKEYSDFWQQQKTYSAAWIGLMLAIAGVGAEVVGQASQDQAILVQAEDLRRLTTHALVLADYTLLQPYVIETFMIHIKSLLLKHHDVTSETYLLLGIASRLCTQSGYHRDAAQNLAINSFQAEMRRRVWLFICEYDVLICYQRGMFSIIEKIPKDTAEPSNLFDSDLTTDVVPSGRPITEFTPMTNAIMYGRLTRVVGDIIWVSQGVTHSNDAEIDALEFRLEQVRDGLPPRLRFVPIDESIIDSEELTLDRYRLEILYLKALCILHQRYLLAVGQEHRQQRCLEAAEQLINHEITLLEACLPGGRFACEPAIIRRHVHDFNLAAVLLCSYLKASQTKGDSLTATKINKNWPSLLLRASALWEEVGVTSARARYALRAIRQFCQHQTDRPTENLSFVSEYAGMSREATGFHEANGLSSSSGPTSNPTASMTLIAGLEVVPSAQAPTQAARAQNLCTRQSGSFAVGEEQLFQEVFGTAYSTQGDFQLDWP